MMKPVFAFALVFFFCLSASCTKTLAADNDNNDSHKPPPTLLQWLFGISDDGRTESKIHHDKENSTVNSTVNNTNKTLVRKVRQLLHPAQALLLQQQQQQQQQQQHLQAAAINQAIIHQQLNGDFDDSSEEDDFDSDEFWDQSSIRHRGIPGVVSPGLGGMRLYRSGEIDSGEDTNNTSSTQKPSNSSVSFSPQITTKYPQTGSTSSLQGNNNNGSLSTLAPGPDPNNGTTLSTVEPPQPQNEAMTTMTTTTMKPNRRPPPYRANLDCRCGTQTVQEAKIRDAQVGINSYPWMVAIRAQSVHLCSGEIINSRFIITSASCLQGYLVQDMTIEGSLLSANRTELTPIKIFVHPQYNEETHENNLALIQVEEDIKPTKAIKFVCLPIGKKPKLDSGTLVTWTQSKNQNLTLVEAQVQQIKEKRCKELLAKVNATSNLTPNTFCTAPPPHKQCGSDVGGSYLTHGKGYSFTLSGVISWTGGCKKQGIPAVMTNTHEYVRWILFKSQSGSFCSAPQFSPNEFNNLPE